MEDRKMTIYFRKSTGVIDSMVAEICDMSWYGSLQNEYELTHDCIVIDYDEYVVNNLMMFKVEDKKLKLKNNDLNKYM